VRAGLADRLTDAARRLPIGLTFRVIEGHRSPADQKMIIAAYSARLLDDHPDLSGAELARLSSRFAAPIEVAPHVAGAAVDLTLADEEGAEIDLGTPVDATPEDSGGACCFDAPGLSPSARFSRLLLAEALGAAGFVNYPTEWWHWSYGDRYWALATGAPAARYDAVPA